MKKYKGNLFGSTFLQELNRAMGINTEHYDVICCHCHHCNGECEDFARKGACKAYEKYHDKIREPVNQNHTLERDYLILLLGTYT